VEARASAKSDGTSARTRIRQGFAGRSSVLVRRRSIRTHGSAVVGSMIAHVFLTISWFFDGGGCSGASISLRHTFQGSFMTQALCVHCVPMQPKAIVDGGLPQSPPVYSVMLNRQLESALRGANTLFGR